MRSNSSWSLRARFLLAISLLTLVLCAVFAFAVHEFVELLEDELLHRTLVHEMQELKTELAENAQAAITWDIEGEQFPQGTTFIGDPRLVDTLDPEMSGVIDAYFKKFTDAGIKVGMTIAEVKAVLPEVLADVRVWVKKINNLAE